MNKLHRKGALEDLGNLVTALAFLAVLAAIVFLIMGELGSFAEEYDLVNATLNDYGIANETVTALGETTEAAADVPGWFPIVVITVIGMILLALIRGFRQ